MHFLSQGMGLDGAAIGRAVRGFVLAGMYETHFGVLDQELSDALARNNVAVGVANLYQNRY